MICSVRSETIDVLHIDGLIDKLLIDKLLIVVVVVVVIVEVVVVVTL